MEKRLLKHETGGGQIVAERRSDGLYYNGPLDRDDILTHTIDDFDCYELFGIIRNYEEIHYKTWEEAAEDGWIELDWPNKEEE